MSELDEIRKKKLGELQNQQQEQTQLQGQLEQIETLAKQKLTKNALFRFGTVKSANPELAMQAMAAIVQIKKDIINDEDLKRILLLLQPKKRDIKITRK